MPGIWTAADETGFAKALTRLATMFGRELTEDVVAIYREELDDLDGDQTVNGLRLCVRGSRFWPSVAEVRERAGANNATEMQRRIESRPALRAALDRARQERIG